MLLLKEIEQQKDERSSATSLLFTQHNNMGTDMVGFQITVFISYKHTHDPATQVHYGPLGLRSQLPEAFQRNKDVT